MAATDDVAESQVVASSSSSTSGDNTSLLVQRAIDHLLNQNKLSANEKEHLEKLIQKGDTEILSALERLSTSEQIEEQILNFLRRSRDQKMEDVDPYTESLNKACSQMCSEADTNAKIGKTKRSLKHITKILKSLKNNSSKARNRMLLKSNFAVKKFVLDTPGAVEYLQAIGFRDTDDEKGVEVLQIDENDCSIEKLEQAMAVLDQGMERLVPIKTGGPRIKCKTCDFWGDPQLGGMCSVCHKNKGPGDPEKPAEAPADAKPDNPDNPDNSDKPAEPKPEPKKCINGCGFWGSDEFDWLCSSCYKNKYPEKAAAKAKKNEVPKRHWRAKLKTARVKLDAMRRFKFALETAQKDKSRCWKCNKKIGLMGIQCKCRYFFCGKHRSTLDHKCHYDYKTDFERILKKANPQVEGQKFEKMDD